jgi:hypothetical protein
MTSPRNATKRKNNTICHMAIDKRLSGLHCVDRTLISNDNNQSLTLSSTLSYADFVRDQRSVSVAQHYK